MTNHMKTKLRSQEWFDNPDNPGHDRALPGALSEFRADPEELQSGKPIIGIAQTGRDLSPCNRHHIVLAEARARRHPRGGRRCRSSFRSIRSRRPASGRPRGSTATSPILAGRGALRLSARRRGADDRLRQDHAGLLMAAATVNIPAIALSVGPMLNGWHRGERTGSGTIVWKAREMLAAARSTTRTSSDWSPLRRRRPAIATRWARRRR